MRTHGAVIYVGSTAGAELPGAFIDDIRGANALWVGENIEALTADDLVAGPIAPGPFPGVSYRGVRLSRDAPAGIRTFTSIGHADVLATAVGADGVEIPWAIRSGRLTYIGENPLAWVTPGDRSLAFAHLLFDLLAPEAPSRHRAVVRIEDVSVRSDPERLRAIADELAARRIPFAIALIPVFVDPPIVEHLRDAPAVVASLHYMLDHGGTLVLHGYTHQRHGVSGADYEFYRAERGPERDELVGPVEGDSSAWADDRIARALAEIAAAGLPRPAMFEYPHYAGSAVDSCAIARRLPVAFQRETFFASGPERMDRALSLTFPFVVDDVYGFSVVPENLGFYTADDPDGIVRRAEALHVVRDGVAGFFVHPTFEPAVVGGLVDRLREAGWSFVSAAELGRSSVARTPPRCARAR